MSMDYDHWLNILPYIYTFSFNNNNSWCEHKNYKVIFDALNADVICLQETKLTPDKLDSSVALIDDYDAYFSMTQNKTGYSGVATYVKTGSVVGPFAAGEGISGVLCQNRQTTRNNEEQQRQEIIGGHFLTEFSNNDLLDLDAEGRCVILDFGLFVLLNVYCPHESNTKRLPFILDFYEVLQLRVEALIKAGKNVIVVGDINVTHMEIDHCDPQRSVKEHGLKSFTDHPARKWFDGFLMPKGPMFHPNEEKMYTCWNTVIDARPVNYGTRLDYVLSSEGLLSWIKLCDIQPHIMGSDHCPVIVELFEEIKVGELTIKLLGEMERLATNKRTETPDLCARFLPQFSGNQLTLQNYFQRTTDLNNKLENPKDLNISLDSAGREKAISSSPLSSPRKFVVNKSGPSKKSKFSNSSNMTKSKKQQDNGQRTLASFFKSASSSSEDSVLPYVETDQKIGTDPNTEIQNPSELYEATVIDAVTSEKQDTTATNTEREESSRTLTQNSQVQSQWMALFTPPPIPKCIVHGEKCKEYRVNKSGPNHGRKFYMCSRPVGTSPEDRCNFFEWAKTGKSSSKRTSNEEINDVNKSKKSLKKQKIE
ncbi:7714_t:CDS:2 [Ambispora gerdemannii]|uniref:DNA-(apurinic or apyrimidinic site) endonuclease n=1 Tax=Ambispora gerdemannii TaxID=144530 RepID=A0A9N8YN46_9GLOM|nr:7714_t:CDS:2 [Ambispora gerdemannii]